MAGIHVLRRVAAYRSNRLPPEDDIRSYEDFDLEIEPGEAGSYRARILNSPAGQAEAEFDVPFSELELENFLLKIGRHRGGVRRLESQETEAARDFGSKLFDSVFAGDIGTQFRRSLDAVEREELGLRIRLRLNDAPELNEIPWEFLHSRATDQFVVLSTWTPLVRYINLDRGAEPLTVSPPLRILSMVSSPTDYPPLDVEAEWARLDDSLAEVVASGRVEVTRLAKPTLRELQRAMRNGEYHVFHFIGHGGFDERAQDGLLLLENDMGRAREVSGHALGTILRDARTIRLAVLNSCEGARTSAKDPLAGAAQSLVYAGIDAVVAMQFEISDRAAIVFAHEFYQAVADGFPVDAAISEARRAIFGDASDVEWGTPVLHMRSGDGMLFDMVGDPTPPAPGSVASKVLPPEPTPDEPEADDAPEADAEAEASDELEIPAQDAPDIDEQSSQAAAVEPPTETPPAQDEAPNEQPTSTEPMMAQPLPSDSVTAEPADETALEAAEGDAGDEVAAAEDRAGAAGRSTTAEADDEVAPAAETPAASQAPPEPVAERSPDPMTRPIEREPQLEDHRATGGGLTTGAKAGIGAVLVAGAVLLGIQLFGGDEEPVTPDPGAAVTTTAVTTTAAADAETMEEAAPPPVVETLDTPSVVSTSLTSDITVDGDLGEWDFVGTEYVLRHVIFRQGVDPLGATSTATMRIAHDGDALYLAVLVNDDLFRQDNVGNQIWRGDAVDINLSTGAPGSAVAPGDFQLTMTPRTLEGGPGIVLFTAGDGGRFGPNTTEAPIDLAGWLNGDGSWTLEAVIPWSVFGLGEAPAVPLTALFAVFDNDGEAVSDGRPAQTHIVANVPNAGFQVPDTWGQLELGS